MADLVDNSNEEINLSTQRNMKSSESILEDYIIPKRLIYANSLIKSLKDRKYSWEIEGKKVKIKKIINKINSDLDFVRDNRNTYKRTKKNNQISSSNE